MVDRDLLDRALARLEPEARAVLVLHFYLDIPLSRVAEILGIPTGTVKTRLYRGLAQLRHRLERQGVRGVAPVPAPTP